MLWLCLIEMELGIVRFRRSLCYKPECYIQSRLYLCHWGCWELCQRLGAELLSESGTCLLRKSPLNMRRVFAESGPGTCLVRCGPSATTCCSWHLCVKRLSRAHPGCDKLSEACTGKDKAREEFFKAASSAVNSVGLCEFLYGNIQQRQPRMTPWMEAQMAA